jgi:hypothetical protein
MKSKLSLILSLPLICLTVQPTFAGQKSSADLAKGAIEGGVTTNANSESCVVPFKYGLVGGDASTLLTDFSKGDSETEQELCKIDFSSQPLCPKLNSTNPGVLVVEVKEGSNIKKSEMTGDVCKAKKLKGEDLKIQAKFKQSITCSYAPSALAAYHLSRMMGGQLKTPVAVVKTMDRKAHQEIGKMAVKILAAKPSDIIYKSWAQFGLRDSEGTEPKLYVDGGKFLYGALSENIKKESNYTEVSGVGPYETRYERFSQQPPYKKVTDGRDIEDILGSAKSFKSSISIIQQMADVSNMVVLDTLLSQDDRIGNIHFYVSYASIDANGKVNKKTLPGDDMDIVKELAGGKPLSKLREQDFIDMTDKFLKANPKVASSKKFSPNGVLIREMVLKDNDCGVDVDKRSNKMRKINAIETIRHVTPQTYQAIMALQRDVTIPNSKMKDFFTNTLLYRDIDYGKGGKSFTDNLNKVATVLKTNCNNGSLKIDLDYTYDHENFSAPKKISCD